MEKVLVEKSLDHIQDTNLNVFLKDVEAKRISLPTQEPVQETAGIKICQS